MEGAREGGRERGREGGREGRREGEREGGRERGREGGREGRRERGREKRNVHEMGGIQWHRIEPHLLFAEVSLEEGDLITLKGGPDVKDADPVAPPHQSLHQVPAKKTTPTYHCTSLTLCGIEVTIMK